MAETDEKIQALSSLDRGDRMLDPGADAGLIPQMFDVVRTQPKWMTLILLAYIFVFLAVAVCSAIWFFEAETTRDMIGYATLFLFSTLVVAMGKLWFWMQMNRNTLLREIKRLELITAELSRRS